MSLVLGIDTATVEISAALADEEGLVASFALRGTRAQAETLHPAIEQLLARSGATAASIGAVAVDCGPGRFTGLRVGVAAAKAFAFAWSVPLVTATSTELLRIGATAAEAASGAGYPDDGYPDDEAQLVIPVVDMRRGELAYELPGGGGPLLATPDLLAAALAALGRRVLVVGDGARRYRAELALAVPRLVVGSDVHAAPSAAVLARVGVARLAAGHTTDAISAQPLYLRDADVRVGWETRAPETPAPDDTGQAQGTGQALVDGKGVARA